MKRLSSTERECGDGKSAVRHGIVAQSVLTETLYSETRVTPEPVSSEAVAGAEPSVSEHPSTHSMKSPRHIHVDYESVKATEGVTLECHTPPGSPSVALKQDSISACASPLSERKTVEAFAPSVDADCREARDFKPATNPREARWEGMSEELYDSGTHGAIEGEYVSTDNATPSELLQGKGKHLHSLATLRRQGAVKLCCDDVWDHSRDRSSLLDVQWLTKSVTKLKSLRGHFSLLQQTLPRGNQPYIEMTEDNRNKSGKLLFCDLLSDVDKSFKAACAPYRGLGPAEREQLFFKMFRSRVPLQFPYLSSVALDALSREGVSEESARQECPTHTHAWQPITVADGQDSILRHMLDTCEKRCSPKEKLFTKEKVPGDDGKDSFFVSRDGNVSLWGAGIISPWLYFMSMGSVFCCHIEDYAFGSANVILAPPGSHVWAVWYSVPRRDIGHLHEYLRNLLGSEYTLDCLEQRKLWLDPASLMAWRGAKGERVSVYRHVQGPSEYIATDYGSVHWGVNLGVGWKAAVNFAYPEWREAAESIHQVYKKLETVTGQKRNYRSVPDFDTSEWRTVL